VAGERIRVEVQQRELLGSAESRRLRKQGIIPGVLYGRGRKPHAIAIAERDLRRVLSGEHGLHAILDVVLEGQKTAHASILKDYQQDPLRGRISHFDLQEVRLDQPITVQVVVELVGESPGDKAGGVLSQATREVNVEALPMEVPDRLELDVSSLGMGDSLRVSDLVVPAGVTVLDDPELVIVGVATPTLVVEPEEELAEEEGEEAAEGEAPEGAAAGAESEESAAGEPGTVEG